MASTRRRSLSLAALRINYDNALNALEIHIDDCDTNYANESNDDDICAAGKQLRSLKNAFSVCHAMLTQALSECGHTTEIDRLKRVRADRMKLYNATMSNLNSFCGRDLTISELSVASWAAKQDPSHRVSDDEDQPPRDAASEPIPNGQPLANVAAVSHPIEHAASEPIVARPTRISDFASRPVASAGNNPPARNRLEDNDDSTSASSRSSDITAMLKMLAARDLANVQKFDGAPADYVMWRRRVNMRIRDLDLNDFEAIQLLSDATTGEPRRVVDTYASFSTDDSCNLRLIRKELDSRFGCSSAIANSLQQTIANFSPIECNRNTSSRLRELSDLCERVLGLQSSVPDLCTLDTSAGLSALRSKLPGYLATRWRKRRHEYGARNAVGSRAHPPFEYFCKFLKDASEEASLTECDPLDPGKALASGAKRGAYRSATALLSSARSEPNCADTALVSTASATQHDTSPPPRLRKCPLHRSDSHCLVDCKKFVSLSPDARKTFASQNGLCFRCFGAHLVSTCSSSVKCSFCNSDFHHSLLHFNRKPTQRSGTSSSRQNKPNDLHSSNSETPAAPSTTGPSTAVSTLVSSSERSRRCTKSCGKTIPVVISYQDVSVRCFAILDDQSTSSFISPELRQLLSCPDSGPVDYSLSTLDGMATKKQGRICKGLVITGTGQDHRPHKLPPVITIDSIPDTSGDFASSSFVQSIPSIASFARFFPPDSGSLTVHALIGRDATDLMITKFHTTETPLVVETPLGWALVGPIERNNSGSVHSYCCFTDHFKALPQSAQYHRSIIDSVPGDESVGLSQDDSRFLDLMKRARVADTGHIQLPLPRKSLDVSLPNNKVPVERRMRSSLASLSRRPEALRDCVDFMGKMIARNHVEQVPIEEIDNPGFYIPTFPVSHPKKGKTRMVFDSAASFDGVSLNSALLQGPDVTNSLLSVLLRFREGVVAAIGDIESMFHCFLVEPNDRDCMRFFWFDANDPSAKIVPYRARVHVFGNCSSPAVATYGLRFAASSASAHESRAKVFINECFYVDDGLLATDSVDDAVDTLESTRCLLARFNIRLHKFISSSVEVLGRLPDSELASEKHSLFETQFDQRALGVRWNLRTDALSAVAPDPVVSFTKRGIVSLCNSTFDPLGIVCPIVLAIRLLFREIVTHCKSLAWDDELPDPFRAGFESFLSQLCSLPDVCVPRSIIPSPLSDLSSVSLHAFSDASCDSIGFAIYLASTSQGHSVSRLVLAGNKVSPKSACTIPRLELCAAVSAVRASQTICDSLRRVDARTVFYTDSRVVLGYINNSHRRFQRYVSNRVAAILTGSEPADWHFVPTDLNPADLATRPQTAASLRDSFWTTGPDFLTYTERTEHHFVPVDADDLPERVQEKTVLVAVPERKTEGPFDGLMARVSRWTTAVNVMTFVLTFVQLLFQLKFSRPSPSRSALRERAISLLLRSSQIDIDSKHLPSVWRKLTPFYEPQTGLYRAMGRIGRAPIEFAFRHPVLLNNSHIVSSLLVDHYHRKTGHQGRRITAASLRDAGFLIIGAARLIRKRLSECTTCRLIRFLPKHQFMADLPPDRLESRPPFESCGADVFGPYQIPLRLTRRSPGKSKIWLLLCCCLYSRAVHLEMLFSLSTEAFINALRRFISLRGACKRIRCDRGTNFVGASNVLSDIVVSDRVANVCNVEFLFNPPGASHYGGVFESKIRSVRRVLDQTIALCSGRLALDEFATLVSEAAGIVNSTPYLDVLDSELQPLSPSVLLHSKRFDNISPLPNPTNTDLHAYGTRRWRRVQFLADQFWQRWRSEYLANLIPRAKWLTDSNNLRVGDVVLIYDKSTPRASWPLARVIRAEPGPDGRVRRLGIVTATGREFERAPSSLILIASS